MKKPNIIFVVILLQLLLGSLSATQWEILETDEAYIYYPKTHHKMAIETAYYLKKHQAKIKKFSGHNVTYKTPILIQDMGMTSNGYAEVFNNRLSIFTPAPGSSLGETFNYNWLETVTIHELFHNYHLQHSKGKNRYIKTIFGNITPHILLPNMIIEGLATYQESQLTPYQGRLNIGFYDSILLTKAKEKKLASFTQASATIRHFPRGQQYIYGSAFIQYLAQTYSEEAITTFLKDYSYKMALNPYLILPQYSIDSSNHNEKNLTIKEKIKNNIQLLTSKNITIANNNFKRSFKNLYKDFQEDLADKSQNWILPQNPLTRGESLSQPIIHNGSLYSIKTILHYTKPNQRQKTYQLVKINTQTNKETLLKVLYAPPILNPIVIKDNHLYLGLKTQKKGFANSDKKGFGASTAIYNYNLTTTTFTKELTDTITSFMIDTQNDIIYAKQIAGKHQTHLIHAKTKTILATHPLYITSLTSTKEGIIVTAKHAEGSSNIYKLTNNYQTLTPLIATSYIESHPIIKDKWLYFTANYNKRFQLYRKHLETQKIDHLQGPSYMTKGTIHNNIITYVSLDSESMTLNQDPLTTIPFIEPEKETLIKPTQTKQYQELNYKVHTGKNVWLKNSQALSPYLRGPVIFSENKQTSLAMIGKDNLGYLNYTSSIKLGNSLDINYFVQTVALQPITLSFTQNSQKIIKATIPIYTSSITALQEIETSIASNFTTIYPAIAVILRKGFTQTTVSGYHFLNDNASYAIHSSFTHYFQSSQLYLSVNQYSNTDISIQKRGLLIESDESITQHSISLDYTLRHTPIMKSFYNKNMLFGDSYLSLFIEYLPFYSEKAFPGIEYMCEYHMGNLTTALSIGIAIEEEKTRPYFNIMLPI